MCSFHAHRFRKLADAATRFFQLVNQVITLELLTRLPQRQVEQGFAARFGGVDTGSALAQAVIDFLGRDLGFATQGLETLHQVA